MRNFLFCLSVLTSFNLFAAPDDTVGSVVKSKGTVTKLLPGSLDAIAISTDEKIPEDTSIVTGPKSFIKIKFIDNSEVTVGPDSKIVISEMTADGPAIIALLHGKMRFYVPVKNNYFIHTRTAVVNARGSEAQLIYNPKNRVTSLLTFRGTAMMAKMDESSQQRFEKSTTVIERPDNDSAPEIRVIPGKPLPEKEILTKVLKGSSTVSVPSGQTSFTSGAMKRASLPVKLNAVQANAFYKNREYDEKNSVNMKSGMELENPKLEVTMTEQVAPVEGKKYNSKSGEYAPRSEGLIDGNSALYIAPVSRMGDFDADTGDYFAPKGLMLDPAQGYLLEKNADVKPELLALREDLNSSINRDVVVGDLGGSVQLTEKTITEKYIRDRLTLGFKAGNQTLEQTPEVGTAPSDLDAKGALEFSALWQIATTTRFSPLLGLAFKRVGYNALAERDETQDSKSLFAMTMGLKYALAEKIDLFSTLVLDQAHYAHQVTQAPITFQYKRIVLTRMNFGAEGELMRSKRFSLMGEGSGNFAFRKKINNQVVSEISGYNFKLTPQYAVDEKRSVGVGLYFGMEKVKSTTPSGSTEQRRNDHGVELKYIVNL